MFNTLPYNYFPASTAKFEEGKNDAIQAEIDAIKDGTNIDSFGDVETALSLKVNSADMETALATKTNLSNIAPTFNSESGIYDIGEQVIYEGVLYEFISAHDTPGDWDSTEVQAVKISELIDTLNSNLNTLESGLIGKVAVKYSEANWSLTHAFPVETEMRIGVVIIGDGTTYTFEQFIDGSVALAKISGTNNITPTVSDGNNVFTLDTSRSLTIWTT